jgi:hypothetical protein
MFSSLMSSIVKRFNTMNYNAGCFGGLAFEKKKRKEVEPLIALEMDEKSFSWLQEATVKGNDNWRDMSRRGRRGCRRLLSIHSV